MSRARGLAAIAMLASSLVLACGDNRFPIEILGDQEVSAYCARAVRCGQYRDVNTCLFEFDAVDVRLPAIIARAVNPAYAAAVGSGAVLYDEAAGRACVEAIADASCDVSSREVRLPPDACTAMFAGTAQEGMPCGFDQECASDRCTPAGICPDDFSCCLGTCASPPHAVALAEPCQIDSDCAVDAFCSGAGCHALLASGESCSASEHCDFDLLCLRPSPAQSGECGSPPKLGEACPDHLCADVGATCGANGTCVPLGLPSMPCVTNADCGPSQSCDPSSHCALQPQLGEPCTTACGPDAWCDPSQGSGTCVAPLPDGAQCAFDEQCTGLRCAEGEFATTCIERLVCF